MAIKLGAKYKDPVTGFTGIATGYARYLGNFSQALLEQPVDANGNQRQPVWIEWERLVLVEEVPK